MSEEKKTVVTEEVKEEARKLSMEELEHVIGGLNDGEDYSGQCSHIDPEYGVQCDFCMHADRHEKWCTFYNVPTYKIPDPHY